MNKIYYNFSWKDILFITGAVWLMFGCIASLHRSGKVLEHEELSLSGSYLRAENLDNGDAEPIQLAAVDARMGLGHGFDFGLMHTWDLTKDNDGNFATFWGEVRYQITNQENKLMMPILTTGLMKGYVYSQDAEIHITTFPLTLSLPVTKGSTPFFTYRLEYMSDAFIPSELKEPRHTFALGMELDLSSDKSQSWIPKMGFSIGQFNSLIGGEGDSGLILNLGFMFNTHVSH